jgi:hypothetical protein
VLEIRDDPETKRWVAEAQKLKDLSPEEFCKHIDFRPEVRELLGKNFLGAEAWSSQGIDVGVAPPIPSAITKELLLSECPLHPGELIRDTHILLLVPKTANGEAYTALKLGELCAMRENGEKLIYDQMNKWKRCDWAKAPKTASEWALIPKSDPVPSKVAPERHFREKSIEDQHEVHKLYPEYREVRALELMTLTLMDYLVNRERLLEKSLLRCEESAAQFWRICVGLFDSDGLAVCDDIDDVSVGYGNLGLALARKLGD